MKQLYSILILGFFSINVFSQDVYRTLHGDIAISLTKNDSTILLVSNSLQAQLDYETSKINFHVAYSSFTSGIDSIDKKLKAFTDTALDFTGKMNITINTKNFAAQKYNLDGTLTNAVPPAAVRGNGSMACIPSGDRNTPACTLLLSFETTLAALNLTEIFPNADFGVRIDLRQSILEKMD